MKPKKIAVIGLGYVGLPLALLASKKGHQVTGVDLDEEKVKKIKSKISPIEDAQIEEDIKKYPLNAVTTFSGLTDIDVYVVCVPTPVEDDFRPNLKPLESAVKATAKQLQKGQLVIIESTINPGVCDDVVQPILEKTSGLKLGRDFYLAHCPERINPGDAKWNVSNIPRVVGANDKQSTSLAVEFYKSIVDADIRPMSSIKEAEAVKIVENAFRDVNLAFVNELAISFSKLGINAVNVIDAAATKPFAFMPHYPGAGVGGHCIPVDPYYLIEHAKGVGFDHEFLSLARRINSQMPEFTVETLQDALNKKELALKGCQVAVLGLAYKPNVDDDRNSPAYDIIKLLKGHGAEVVAYDSHLPDKSTVASLSEALQNSQAAILVTSHNEFKKITPQMLKKHDVKVLIDGRNAFHNQKAEFAKNGIVYYGIGT